MNFMKDKEEPKYCAITEQGDLGLGADVLGAADQKVMREAAMRAKLEEEKKKNKK